MGFDAIYMLDTNAIIAIRRSGAAANERLRAMDTGTVVMSVVTYGELLYGIGKSADPDGGRATLERLARAIPVLHLEDRDAVHYGDIRCELARRGMMIGANDLWIAAQARSRNLTLVTANRGEFERVPGLRSEDWFGTGAACPA